MFYPAKLVTLVLLILSNLSLCKHVFQRDTGYKESYNILHKLNGEQNDKLKSGYKHTKNNKDATELRKRDSSENVFDYVLRPDWKVKSSRTESYSFERFIPDEDSSINGAADLEKPNRIHLRSVDMKITQKQETCFHTIQNEIANLFDEDFDISKSIFPLCCKTETKCKPKTTQCMKVLKTSPKCSQKKQERPNRTTNTLKKLTSNLPTSVHHTVSNEAVVNVVIHVKCDHPEAREHVLPNTIPLHPPLNCASTKNYSLLDFEGSKYNLSVNYSNSKTTEVTRYSIFKTKDSVNETKLNEEPCIKKYENGRPAESPDDKLFGDQETTDNISKNEIKMKFPQPLLPHDITIQIRKPTYKPQTTLYPDFICQITPRFCKFTSSAMSGGITKSIKPGFTLWRKMSLPNFWHGIPTTPKVCVCQEIEITTEYSMCRNKQTEDQTTEENVLDRVSCSPDRTVPEEPSLNNCGAIENSNSESNLPESETCEPSLKTTENTEYSPLVENENNESGLTLIIVPIPIEGTKLVSPAVEPSLLPNKGLDQTLSEPYTEPMQEVTESAQSSSEREKLSTELYRSYPGNVISPMEADHLLTGRVSNSLTTDLLLIMLEQTPDTFGKPHPAPGQGLKQNILKPDNQDKTTVENNNSSSTTKIDGYKSSTLSPGNFDPLHMVKSTQFFETPTINEFLENTSEEHISTISINKLIESEHSIIDFSTSASEAAVDILEMINKINSESTVDNPASSIMMESSTHTITTIHSSLDNGISNESTTFPTTTGTHSFEKPNQTDSALPTSPIEEHLKTVEENTSAITDGDIGSIIKLNNNSFLFYRKNKWFITNKNQLWNFNEGTVEIMNDTFAKMSIEHSTDNNEKNKEFIKHMISEQKTFNESLEVPFEIFAQTILIYSEYNHDISSFEWLGIYFNLQEMIAMLRIISVDSLTANEWGSVNWMSIWRLVKESNSVTSHDINEYNITEVDGSVQPLIVFSNGSSIWKNIKLDRSEILNITLNLNSETYFFKQTMIEPYSSNDPSFTMFIKNIFEQRINLNITYSEYIWKSGTYNWDEVLALLIMINNMLSDITNLELIMLQHWDDLLAKFRNSKRHYYTDRTVYEISFDTELKPMTIFTNGTTEFDGKRITLEEVAQRVRGFTVPEVTTADIQHIISLGGGKFQFYWNQKWYITDYTRTWSFEDQTNVLMNESFFSLPEDLTISPDSIQTILLESTYNNNFEMPFELFAQSMLSTAKYSEDIYYQWSGYPFSYADILAMLRLSSFDNFDSQVVGYKWGHINWFIINDKVKQSPKSKSPNLKAYEMLDYDGFVYPLIVFSNGTSIWKHTKLDLSESLTILKNLNKESHFPDVISVTSYMSSADSFLSFMADAISDRIHNKILHSFYIWKDYQFKWEDLVAINRILMHHYESKLANDLSFSKIALPVLSSTKQVFPNRTEFQVSLGSENKSLIVYPNGTTEYDSVSLEFMDTVQQVEELKKSSSISFKEDWGSGVITLKEVKDNSGPEDNSSSSKGSAHGYDWTQLNNNPYFNVCYPINIGGGKVQFYMKNTWFITDGENIWPFEDPLTNFYINEMAKTMNHSFGDDHHLDKETIQSLVDNKQTLKGFEELVMPHELIIQQYLFFMKHLDQQVALKISKDIIYVREKQHINAIQLLVALRISAYNSFTTKEVELSWGKGKKVNWDWFFLMSKRIERMEIMNEWTNALNTSYFDEFHDTPLIIVYSNFSSDWGGQHLTLDEALLKVQNTNEHNNFFPVSVNGELTSKNESFEWLYKEALNKRFEHKRIYSKYKWLTDSISWFDLLIVLRFPETRPEAVRDGMFWKNSLKAITRALKIKFSDRIQYEISGIERSSDLIVTIYMNETTVLNEKKMEIEDYRVLLQV